MACLDDCPTPATIRDFLDTVPDQKLLAGPSAARGHGREDYLVDMTLAGAAGRRGAG